MSICHGKLLYGGELYSSLEYILLHLFYRDVLSNLPEVLAAMLICRVCTSAHFLHPSRVWDARMACGPKKLFFVSLGNKNTSCMI